MADQKEVSFFLLVTFVVLIVDTIIKKTPKCVQEDWLWKVVNP